MKKEPPFFSADIQLHHQTDSPPQTTPQAQSNRSRLLLSSFDLPSSVLSFSFLLVFFLFDSSVCIFF
ncbi:hypothetical protein BDV34DRAFT_202011, partial [Aspergillus parasiticus]